MKKSLMIAAGLLSMPWVQAADVSRLDDGLCSLDFEGRIVFAQCQDLQDRGYLRRLNDQTYRLTEKAEQAGDNLYWIAGNLEMRHPVMVQLSRWEKGQWRLNKRLGVWDAGSDSNGSFCPEWGSEQCYLPFIVLNGSSRIESHAEHMPCSWLLNDVKPAQTVEGQCGNERVKIEAVLLAP